jgi:HlyD family secretion protein
MSEKDEKQTNDSGGTVTAPDANASAKDAKASPQEFIFPDTPRKKRKKGWIIAGAIVLVLVLLFVLPRLLGIRQNVGSAGGYGTYTVQRSDITVTLSGSGTLQPADSYTVTSLITGDILTAPFEEGDTVAKDQVLYTVDSSDVDTSIQQAENNVSDSQEKYNNALQQLDDLNLKAGGGGIVADLNVKAGDTVQAGQTVAVIRDSGTMKLPVLFQQAVAESFYVGETADVTLVSNNESFTGTVTDISTVDQVLSGNILARTVTITVSNPGAMDASQTAYAAIGGITGLQNGTLEYGYQGNVTAAASGKVTRLNVKEGDTVSKGQLVAVLQSDAVDQQVQSAQSAVENAQLSLESQNNKLDAYAIKSPISGTIVEKIVKGGDTLQTGAVLCTIFDLSHLTLTLNVDELDIMKVKPGQTVTITAGAAEGKEYTGTVTKVNIKGTTKNGVTSFPVTIEIDKTDGLLPGMNVDARIVVESLENVLTVPVGAVMRNNFVLLKTADTAQKATEPGIPAGYSYTEVMLGPANDENIVITGGLKEGDIVAVMDNTPSAYNYDPFGPRVERAEGSEDGGGDSGGNGGGSDSAGSPAQAPQSSGGAAG